ncbi:unnamed protein product [Miscanthus lutarioriparius]|uniref:hAT-like transposase RNase-H fold domain-containing protein n=1 Tax=Miscanthus lutarioriparius TaxID=422564 RepID=A0A811QLC4_9POAL|nr:unnamed protein product [Miscanthus lutarioriparius]
MGMSIPAVAGGRNLALDSHSSMVEQEEAGEDGGHEASKILASASEGLGRQISGVASSSCNFLQTDKYGCVGVDMATLPSELAPEELSGQEADQQRSKHTTSRSMNVKKSLLVKRKSSAVNAPKPPTEKWRKSSASNVQFVRSPLLNRILASPRMRHSRAKHQRSPYAGLSSSTLPDDTRTDVSPNLDKDAASRSVDRIKSLLSKQKSYVVNASNHSEGMQRKSSASCVHYLLSATRDNGRSACRRHLKVCKERTRMNQLVENMNTGLSPDSLALKNWKFDQEVSRKAMVNFIVLQKRIIGFGLVSSPHDGFTLFNALLKCLPEWKLEHKVFSITLDNAKNNNNMVGSLRKNLLERHLMLGNGDLLHMRCVAHVLNLIVKEGFKVIDGATNRIRDSAKYIRSSQAHKQRFEEIIVQLVFGTLYPTANHCFYVLWEVKGKIETLESNIDISIAVMATKMKLKFQKYWDICLLQICVLVVLDPRFKLSFVSFRLDAGFGDKGPAYTEMVKATLQNLFFAYSSMAPDLNYSQPEPNDIGDGDDI